MSGPRVSNEDVAQTYHLAQPNSRMIELDTRGRVSRAAVAYLQLAHALPRGTYGVVERLKTSAVPCWAICSRRVWRRMEQKLDCVWCLTFYNPQNPSSPVQSPKRVRQVLADEY